MSIAPTELKGLTDEIERELMAWRGANGGVFTLRAAAVAVAQAVEALAAVQPYLDAIVCYASTLDEHDGNRVARLVTSASAAARGETT